MADPVIDLIDDHGHGHLQSAATLLGNLVPFEFVARLRDGNAGLVIARHSPTVGRVCFADVDRQKLGAILIARVQFLQGPELGPVGRSGKVAEDQHHRLVAAVAGQADGRRLAS